MIKKTLIMVTLSLTLSACSSLHDSILNEQERISDTAYDYIYKKFGSIDRIILPLQKPTLENEIYRFHSTTDYFSFSNQEIDTFNDYLSRECLKLNGNFNGSWCVKNEKPLFFAKISSREINIDDPINKNSDDWSYLVKQMGFRSDSEIEKEYIELERNALKSIEYERNQYSKTLTSDIGTMICKKDEIESSSLYIGYIDAKEKSKIKVLIIKKGMYIDNQITEIKIEQKQIWDDIKNWYVCDYNIQY